MQGIRERVEDQYSERLLLFGALYACGSILALIGYYALDGDRQVTAYNLFGLFSIACILLGISIHRPSWPLPWFMMAGGLFVLKIGDVVFANYEQLFGREAPYPSLADLLFFIGNTIVFAALVLVLRAREPYRDTGSVIDAAIIATAGAALAWIFIMDPYANDPSMTQLQRITALSTPIFDLITLVLITRLIFGTGLRTVSFYLLLGGMVSCMVADVVYSEIVLHTSFESGDLLDIGWILWFLLYGAAALVPSMARIAEPGPQRLVRLTRGRLALLTAAVLLVPAVTLIQWRRDEVIDVPVVVGASAVAFVLVVFRMTGLVHTAESAQRDLGRSLDREQVMKQASLSLVSATSRTDVYQSAASAIGTLINESAEGRVLHLNESGDYEVVAATNHRDTPVLGRRLRGDILTPETREQLRRGAPQTLERDTNEKLWTALNLADRRESLVLSPVISQSGETAALGLAVAPDESKEAVSLLTALCSQVSLALERVSLAERLHRRESEERFHSLVQNASDVILIIDNNDVITYASPSVRRVFGIPEAWLVGSDFFSWVHVDDYLGARAFLSEVIEKPGAIQVTDFRMRDGKSTWRSVEITGNNLLNAAGVHGVVINARDISERKRAEEQLTYQAFHDALTNLPNRTLFMDRLARELEMARASGVIVAILFIDLDRFKLVNDSLGHDAGDHLLREAGRRITNGVRSQDMVARLGGDEFTVMMVGLNDPSEPITVARRLLDSFSKPLIVGEREVFVDASIGISINDGFEGDPGELLRQADIAMYQAKDQGGQSLAVFDSKMGSSLLMRLEMETDLRHAVERDELELYYQPEIDLKTSRIIATEALVRWNHPRLGFVSPGDFIPLAEETGLILGIGRWVMHQACKTAQAWLTELPHLDITMSVNLSVRQYLHPGIVEEIAEVLRSTGLAPRALRLEITETMLMDDKATNRATLEHLHRLGVQLAIDDFGSGYSNLGYLKRLPVETLKIDQIFIKGLGRDHHDAAIVSAITTLAHEIGMKVTAEGVETAEQMLQIKRIGCDHAQGFYFSEPISESTLTARLRTDSVFDLTEAV